MGVIERYRDRLPVGPDTPDAHARRGRDAADPLAADRRAARRRPALQVRGDEPDRQLQGPRDGGRGREGGRGRRRRRSSAPRPGTPPPRPPPTRRAPGLTAVVLCPAGAVAAAKLAQSRAVGARVLEVAGSFDEALAELPRDRRARARSCSSTRSTRTGSRARRPRRSRSTRQLGRAPDVLALPYGGGGNTVAYAKGFAEDGVRPRMISAHAVDRATTMASAIRIAEPAHLAEVEALVADGTRRAGRRLRRGHHANVARAREPARGSSASRPRPPGLAALEQLELEPGSTVVCVLTGHGLKDTAAVDVLTPRRVARRADVDVDPRGGARVELVPHERFVVRAPATTANLGPGLRLRRRGARPLERAARRAADGRRAARDASRARAPTSCRATRRTWRCGRSRSLAPLEGHRFHFVNRIPLERGLGSSAATIAAGLVAGLRPRPGATLARASCSSSGCRSRATPTTSPPALAGGVCLIWRERRRPDARAARRRPAARRRSSSCPTRA